MSPTLIMTSTSSGNYENQTVDVPFPLHVTRAIRGDLERLTGDDQATLARITRTDWAATALDISSDDDIALAARAVSLGASMCYSFANIYAIAAHPNAHAVIAVNRMKGRPDDQVGSISTTPEHMLGLFDWTALTPGVDLSALQGLMGALLAWGPFGFRGPAATGIPAHLTSLAQGVMTTQLISPGAACPSNRLLTRITASTGLRYVYVTSANISKTITGAADEPAHYRLRGLQADFGRAPGFFSIAHPNEDAAQRGYPGYAPTSTSILSFHAPTRLEDGRYALTLERHGSLPLSEVRRMVEGHGFGLNLGPGAHTRLPQRCYTPAPGLVAG